MTESTVHELRPEETPAQAPSASTEIVNTKDYDQIISGRPAFRRTIGGKTIEFPKFLPAKVLLAVRKSEIERKKRGVKESDEDAMWGWGFDLLRDILGPDNFEHITAYGDLDIVMDITMDALVYYGLRSEKEEEDSPEGKAVTGEKVDQSSQSTPSLSTSTPSTPTSSDTSPESGTPSGDATHPTGSETGDSTSLGLETSPKGVSS